MPSDTLAYDIGHQAYSDARDHYVEQYLSSDVMKYYVKHDISCDVRNCYVEHYISSDVHTVCAHVSSEPLLHYSK